MRHSTLELTGRYTRPRAVDIEAARLNLSPRFVPMTDRPMHPLWRRRVPNATHKNVLAHICATGGDVVSRNLSHPDVMMDRTGKRR